MCLILSLALPLDRAKPCFVIATTLFGFITFSAIVGMVFYLAAAGFYPEHLTFDPIKYVWTPQGDHHFSWLVLAGVIMLAIYTIPFLLRPIDFLENFKGYVVGMIAYLILIPMFANIFSIYSMANLHDISWGNRPTTSTGTEAFSDKENVQKKT
jgi:F0F1-type ATP synthase membrane subunit a